MFNRLATKACACAFKYTHAHSINLRYKYLSLNGLYAYRSHQLESFSIEKKCASFLFCLTTRFALWACDWCLLICHASVDQIAYTVWLTLRLTWCYFDFDRISFFFYFGKFLILVLVFIGQWGTFNSIVLIKIFVQSISSWICVFENIGHQWVNFKAWNSAIFIDTLPKISFKCQQCKQYK